MRERVRAKVEGSDLARRSFTTFRVKRRSSAVGSPHAFSRATSLRIVDPAVHPFRVESHGIRDTKHNKLPAVRQHRKQRVISVAGSNRHVLPQSQSVELIHPIVITGLGASWICNSLQLRPRYL